LFITFNLKLLDMNMKLDNRYELTATENYKAVDRLFFFFFKLVFSNPVSGAAEQVKQPFSLTSFM